MIAVWTTFFVRRKQHRFRPGAKLLIVVRRKTEHLHNRQERKNLGIAFGQIKFITFLNVLIDRF